MDRKGSYRVLVTYGTVRNATYVAGSTKEDAEKLKATAIRLGYRDARVVTEEAYAAMFAENPPPDRRRSSGPRGAAAKAR